MGIFKAYDVRGLYPSELDEEKARVIGNAFATFLGAASRNVVIGRDMRPSSVPLAEAVTEGVRDAGANVTDAGMVTTPMLYFGVGKLEAGGGIMVTASHNPAQWNGMKLCREEAVPVGSASGLAEDEAALARGDYQRAEAAGRPRGGSVRRDVLGGYADMVRRAVDPASVKPMKLAIDAGNGMVGPFILIILEPYPLRLVPLYLEPDGTFPNHEANPLKEENLRDLVAAVRGEGCDLGVAFDGDGDRCRFVDEKGVPVAGDLTTALIARDVLAREKGPVVYDLRSSWAVREEIERAGGAAIEERVGHAFIKRTMRERGALFAGEVSGHFYFRENYRTESAVLALVKMLRILAETGKPLSALVAEVDRYPRTGEVNFHVEDKDAAIARLESVFADAPRRSHLDGITIAYDDWWFNVRKSNTEPLLRLNLEARTPARLEQARARVVETIGGTLET